MLDFARYVNTSFVEFVLSLVGDWPLSEFVRGEGEWEGLSPEVGVVERSGRVFIVQRRFPPLCHS